MATSSEAFKSFRSSGTLVFANSSTDWSKLPTAAQQVLAQEDMGNTIPQVVVTTADGGAGIQGFGYKTLSEDTRKAVRELKKTLKTTDVLGAGGDSSEEEAVGEASELLFEERVWTNAAGNEMTAAVVSAGEDYVIFRMSNGKELSYDMKMLSEKSQELILESL